MRKNAIEITKKVFDNLKHEGINTGEYKTNKDGMLNQPVIGKCTTNTLFFHLKNVKKEKR